MSIFTRKHYEQLAVALSEAMENDAETHSERELVADIVARVADLFEVDNPRFDRVKFGARCGVFGLWVEKERGIHA